MSIINVFFEGTVTAFFATIADIRWLFKKVANLFFVIRTDINTFATEGASALVNTATSSADRSVLCTVEAMYAVIKRASAGAGLNIRDVAPNFFGNGSTVLSKFTSNSFKR